MASASELKSKAVKAISADPHLSPEEYFVWSRLGEGLKVKDLIPLCPWPEAETLARLEGLLKKNSAIVVDTGEAGGVKIDTQSSRPLARDDITAALDEDETNADLKLLSRDFRMSVLMKYEEIQNAGPYEILEIHPRATESEIRNAYLRISKQYHPDRFFSKKLGPYKRKLETIFSKIQFAHTQLKDPIEREAIHKRAQLNNDSKNKENPSSLSADQKRKLIDPEIERIGRAEHLYKQGLKLLEEKDFVGAGNSFSLAMQTNPQRDQYKKAFEDVKPRMELQRAQEGLTRALNALKLSGASAEVLTTAQEALKLNPQLHEAQYVVGRCLVELNKVSRMRDAKEMLLRAKAALPKNADVCFYLGRALQAMGEDDAAKRAFEEAIKRDPKHAAAKKHLDKDFSKT